MNHPKGDESTDSPGRCSNCPQQLCTAAEPAPTNCGTAAGADIYEGRNLCGGFRPFLLWQCEARPAVLVRRSEPDPADRADRDDQLLALDAERQEPEPGLARERFQAQSFAVGQLDFDVRAVGGMRRGVLLDLAMDPGDEVVERRLGRARDPKIRAQKSFASSAATAPTCSRPSAVITRPRGVRCRKPSWSR